MSNSFHVAAQGNLFWWTF